MSIHPARASRPGWQGSLTSVSFVNSDPLVTTLQLVPLFSTLGTDYFWQYDNNGLKLAQMRFYPISTTTIGGTCTRTAK